MRKVCMILVELRLDKMCQSLMPAVLALDVQKPDANSPGLGHAKA